MLRVVVFLITIVFLASTSSAKIYKWRDESGKLHFSDKPPVNEESYKPEISEDRGNGYNTQKLKFGFSDMNNSTGFDIEVIDAGTVVARDVDAYMAEKTQTGIISALSKDVVLSHRTDRITTELGTRFGIFYKLKSDTFVERLPCRVKVTHPPIHNPRINDTVTVDEWKVYLYTDKRQFDGWTFEYPWEMVPGDWLFEIFYGQHRLGGMKFTVLSGG